MAVRIVHGCIARRRAEAIVTSANAHLAGEANPMHWQFAGRSSADGAIRAAAGPTLADAVQRISGLPLAPCAAVVTCAGALAADLVVHVLAPDRFYGARSASDDGSPARLLRACYASAVVAAEAAGARSIAMPAIGCGVRGWPLSLSAKCALEAFEGHIQEPANGLRHFEVVLLESSAHRVWASTLSVTAAATQNLAIIVDHAG
ncbi:hypothetical protein KFE25_006623 [Diacronema lutheri]|nr:hypothetical protein KFE25_006623 [Diacronema lutheri]